MSGRELSFNVYDGRKIGHANVSFYQGGEHQFTIGANIHLEGPKLALPRVLPFEPDDGIYRDESAYHLSTIVEGTIKSASVPITDLQYDNLLEVARSLESNTFNYSLLTEACVELVEDFYAATGHPGEFGDLFAEEDRNGSLVWSRVPVSDTPASWPGDQPRYSPPEPFMPDPPISTVQVSIPALPDPAPDFSEELEAAARSLPPEGSTELPGIPGFTPAEEPRDPQSNNVVSGTPGETEPKSDDATPGTETGEPAPDEAAEPSSPPGEELPPPDPAFGGLYKQTNVIDPILFEPDAPNPTFPIVTADDDDVGHSPGVRTRQTYAERSTPTEDSSIGRASQASSSAELDSGWSFDPGTDAFDFDRSEPSTDLSFGAGFDRVDSEEAFPESRVDLDFSFDSTSSGDDDRAQDVHSYDEFGFNI